MRALRLLAVAALAALPGNAFAQGHGHGHAPSEAAVDFGILPTAPLGPLPCLQAGGIGGPGDPCSYKLHVLTPEETSIRKDGEVTFQFHGGGHAIAIYEVSKKTTREDIGRFLCPGLDPVEAATPADQPCNPVIPGGVAAANAAAEHIVLDGKGKVVLVADPNVTNAHPDNRVWSPEGRLMSAGGRQFMVGGLIPAGPTSDGQLVTYQFLDTGRYLVICMNRVHFLNDWMFGFVNVN